MTLVTVGYWQSTYWAENYWQQDYWLEYGTAVPPTPAPPTGSGRTIAWTRQQAIRTKRDLLPPEKPTVEVIPQPPIMGMTFEEMVRYVRSFTDPSNVTEEDLRRILEPFIPPRQDAEDPFETLRMLLTPLRVRGSSENGLRKVILDYLRNKEHN